MNLRVMEVHQEEAHQEEAHQEEAHQELLPLFPATPEKLSRTALRLKKLWPRLRLPAKTLVPVRLLLPPVLRMLSRRYVLIRRGG